MEEKQSERRWFIGKGHNPGRHQEELQRRVKTKVPFTMIHHSLRRRPGLTVNGRGHELDMCKTYVGDPLRCYISLSPFRLDEIITPTNRDIVGGFANASHATRFWRLASGRPGLKI